MAAKFSAFKSALFHEITKIQVWWLGSWKEIQRIRRWTKSGSTFSWKDVYIKGGTTPTPSPPPTPTPTPPPPVTLSLTVSPSAAVSGSIVETGTCYTYTADVNVSNGTPPYTYTFSRVSYSGSIAPNILVIPTDSSKAQFSRNMTAGAPETQTARFKCIVKDKYNNKGTIYIDATFYSIEQYGTGGTGGFVNDGGVGSGGQTP